MEYTKLKTKVTPFFKGFRDDPRFLTARDKAYKKVVNDTSIFKVKYSDLNPPFIWQNINTPLCTKPGSGRFF